MYLFQSISRIIVKNVEVKWMVIKMENKKHLIYKEDVLAMAWLDDECEVVSASDIEALPELIVSEYKHVTFNNSVPYPLGGMIYYVETTEESDEAWIANKPIQYIDEEGYHCGWGLATLLFKFEDLNEVYFFSYEEAKANLGSEEDDESIL